MLKILIQLIQKFKIFLSYHITHQVASPSCIYFNYMQFNNTILQPENAKVFCSNTTLHSDLFHRYFKLKKQRWTNSKSITQKWINNHDYFYSTSYWLVSIDYITSSFFIAKTCFGFFIRNMFHGVSDYQSLCFSAR